MKSKILLKNFQVIQEALFNKKEKILIISDLHLGYEEMLQEWGVFIPKFQYKKIIEDLKKIFSKDALKENLGKIISYSEGSIGEVKKMIEDSDYLLKKEKLAEKVEKILLSGSVIEKFKILEDANKDKYIKELLSLFMFVSVGALKKKLSGEDVEFFSEICEKTANHYQTEDLVKIIQKTLKIYENLGYNVNLKLALEEIVLEGQASFTE